MNENHSYGCYNDQVAMGLHDLNKAQIVYPEPTTLEQRAEECYMAYLESNLGTSPKAIKKLLVTFAEQETKLLSEHIRELQNENGKLIDENKEYESEAREVNIRFDNVIKQLEELREIIKGLIKNAPNTYSGTDIMKQQSMMFRYQDYVNRAEQFLGDEK